MQACRSRQDCWCHLCAGSEAEPAGSTAAQGTSQQECQAGAHGQEAAAEKVVSAQAGGDHGGGAANPGGAAGSAQEGAAAAAGRGCCAGEAPSQAAQPARPSSAAKGTKRSREDAEEPPVTNKKAHRAVTPEPGQEAHAVGVQGGASQMQWEAIGGTAVPAPPAAVPAGAGGWTSQGAAPSPAPWAPWMLMQRRDWMLEGQ